MMLHINVQKAPPERRVAPAQHLREGRGGDENARARQESAREGRQNRRTQRSLPLREREKIQKLLRSKYHKSPVATAIPPS